MSYVSSDPNKWQHGSGQETISDHLVFLIGYVVVYVGFVMVQSSLPDPKHSGPLFLMMVCALPFLIGFVPAWWLSRYVCAGRTGWIRHGLVGVASGFVALGIAFALVAGGLV